MTQSLGECQGFVFNLSAPVGFIALFGVVVLNNVVLEISPAWRCTAAAVLLSALGACGEPRAHPSPPGAGEPPDRGVALPAPLARPHFTLTGTDGRPFDFYERTRGSVTLVVTGYTECPDVCPVHLSAISSILRGSPALRDSVKVVFLTADPARDTPERIREWLGQFDPAFIGLTGSQAAVDSAQAALAESPGVRAASTTSTGYEVQHAAQVIAFTADDSAHWVYPFGTRQVDWDADLPRLVRLTHATPRSD
jgi:protein SCO1/2